MNSSQTPKRATFSIASIMLLTALVALIVRWPQFFAYTTPFLVALFAWYLWRDKMDWVAYGLIVLAVYIPSSLGFFVGGQHCRDTWPQLFPVAMCLIPVAFVNNRLGIERPEDWVWFCEAALVVAVILFVSYVLTQINALLKYLALIVIFVMAILGSLWLVAVMDA